MIKNIIQQGINTIFKKNVFFFVKKKEMQFFYRILIIACFGADVSAAQLFSFERQDDIVFIIQQDYVSLIE